MRRIFVVALVMTFAVALLPFAGADVIKPEALPREKAVVIDPNVAWGSSGWAGANDTAYIWEESTEGQRIFHIGAPDKRHVWVYYLGAPIDFIRYPILVMTYRATLDDPANQYILWLDDTRGPNGGGVSPIRGNEFVADGEIQEIRKDLRALSPAGNITGMALGLRCYTCELIGLRFEAAPDAAPFEIGRGEPVRVKVTDPQSNPVPDALVTVDAERLNWAVSARTNAEGVATVTPYANPSGKHMLRVWKEGMTRVELRDASKAADGPITFVLQPAQEYTGKVVDEEGRPIHGVSVHFWVNTGRSSGRDNPRLVSPFSVATDENGVWRSPPLPATTDRITLRLVHPDYLSDLWGDQSTPTSMEKLRAGTQVSVLRKGVIVTGTVRNAKGEPIGSASVAQGDDRFPSNAPPKTTTNAEGVFRFEQTRSGPLTLTVKARGHGPQLVRLEARQGMAPIEITLPEPNTVKFRVVDAQGKPVPDARISADTWRGCRTLEWHKKTDGEGRAVWNEAPAETVLYGIYARGYMSVRNTPLAPREEEHVITLYPPLRVSGKVTDAATGATVERFSVVGGMGWDNDRQPISWQRHEVRPGRNGEYQIEFTYPYPKLYVRIEAEGYAPAVSRPFVNSEGTQAFDFKLTRAADLTGIVRAPDGTVASGATVVLATPGQNAFIQNSRTAQDHNRTPTVTTDKDGRYRFPPQEGTFTLVAFGDAGYAEVPHTALTQSTDITLQPWARIEGTYRIGNKPGAEKQMNVWRHMEHSSNAPTVYHDIKATTDAAGRFVFDRVPPGKGTVSNYIEMGEGRWGGTHHAPYEAQSGAVVSVQIGGTGRPVVGRVVMPADYGKPVNWRLAYCNISTPVIMPPQTHPENWREMDAQARQLWHETWIRSEEGKTYLAAQQEALRRRISIAFLIMEDGAFRIEDVPAGTYHLNITVNEPSGEGPMRGHHGQPIGMVRHGFTIHEMDGGRSDEPLDIGAVEVKLHTQRAAP